MSNGEATIAAAVAALEAGESKAADSGAVGHVRIVVLVEIEEPDGSRWGILKSSDDDATTRMLWSHASDRVGELLEEGTSHVKGSRFD